MVFSCAIFRVVLYSELCSHHHNQIFEHFHNPQSNPYPLVFTPNPAIPPSRWQPLIFLSLWVHLLWIFHVNEIIQYVASFT